jgi:capsular polysaccharide biosynthesis protein
VSSSASAPPEAPQPVVQVPNIRILVIVAVGLITGLLAAGIAYAVSSVMPRTWESQAIVLIGPETPLNLAEIQAYQATASRLAGLVPTTTVLQPVIERLGLDDSVADIRGAVSVTAPEGLSSIDIATSWSTAQGAADLADAIAEQLVLIATPETPAAPSPSPSVDPAASPGPSPSPAPPASGGSLATIVQPAEVPTAPSSPRVMINVLLGGTVGFVIGMGLAWLFTTRPNEV